MPGESSIEWTDMTWNPVTGCTKISQGCKHCYAERFAFRLQAMGADRYKNGFRTTLHWDLIDAPRQWARPRMVFVNSMSDLFHEDVPVDFIHCVFETMADCSHHIFQVLTKRSERLLEISRGLTWPNNVWMGVSVEDDRSRDRIDDLRNVPAKVRFLSCEPLIGPLPNLKLEGIHWVIVGGESGPGARPMRADWVQDILNQCRKAAIPFFFKQWGGVWKKRHGRQLNGVTYDEMPRSITQSVKLTSAG